jgi:hypothetical protein
LEDGDGSSSAAENLPARGPYAVAVNHTGYMDAAVLLSVLPWHQSVFIAKRELGENVLARIFFGGICTKVAGRDVVPAGYPISVTIGAPIAPEGTRLNAAVKLRDRVRADILKHCGEPDLASSSLIVPRHPHVIGRLQHQEDAGGGLLTCLGGMNRITRYATMPVSAAAKTHQLLSHPFRRAS